MTTQLPCIVCAAVPESVDEGTDYHPYGATEFETHGHYGSTAYDPMDSDRVLILNVCDKCLVARAPWVRERTRVRFDRPSHDYAAWNPALS